MKYLTPISYAELHHIQKKNTRKTKTFTPNPFFHQIRKILYETSKFLHQIRNALHQTDVTFGLLYIFISFY